MEHTLSLEQEKQLVIAAKKDMARFADLYEYYLPRIYRYVQYRTSSQADAEDITATVFLKAVEHFAEYEWRGLRVGAWLYRIAHNALVNHYQRRADVTLDDVPEAFFADDAPVTLADRADYELIRMHLQRFPDDVQHAFTLRVTEGMTNKEIAEALGTSEAAVKMLMHRTIKKLQDLHAA